MDFMKEFEEWLPKWSEEKGQPIPTEENADRWSVAWRDFVNEYLAEKKDEIVAEYKNMKFKTRGDLKTKKVEPVEVKEEVAEEPVKEMSEWEKVQAMLKKKS